MSGADSFFLDIESDKCTLNMGLLMILAPGNDEDVAQRVRDTVAEDTPLTRSLKKKLYPAPWNIDHPRWIQDLDFSVDNHILRHELNAASSSAAFNQLVARIANTRMSMEKPPWEVHIISGLDGGETAIVGKLHHSLADGATGMLLIQQLMGIYTPHEKDPLDQLPDAEKKSNGQYIANTLGLPGRLFFSLLAVLTLRLFAFNQYLFKQRLKSASQAAPQTRFNGLLSDKRSYTHGRLPLSSLRKVNAAYKCSRNDAFLAIISGALRRYLLEHGELPERSLYTGLPLALTGDEKRKGAANQLTFYRSSLATNIDDPAQRLSVISYRLQRSMERAKKNWNKRLLERLSMLPPRAIRSIITLYIKLLDKGLFRPNVNVVSTLLPGPGRTASVADREVTGLYPISIPYHGAGLFISAIRYGKNLHFGIIADEKQLPDPGHLAELMQASLDELVDLTDR